VGRTGADELGRTASVGWPGKNVFPFIPTCSNLKNRKTRLLDLQNLLFFSRGSLIQKEGRSSNSK
jgi:hypothetical protein